MSLAGIKEDRAMRIQHNIEAMNANRQLGIVRGSLAKTSRNLSSGYKINSAADDAAGLAISEKMRKQIRGLSKGIENAEDGVSLCQVADGALAEVHDILQRMNELAIKSANGTNSSSDRQAIDAEVSDLVEEIDKIGDTTRFNEFYLFKAGKKNGADGSGTSGGPTASGRFFKLMGKNTTTTGYMQEPLKVSFMNSLITTSSIQGTNPYVGVHIDFKDLIDTKKNIKELAGTSFFVNCCTNCCPAKVEFTDDKSISWVSDTSLKIGLKQADGSYYNSANAFVNAILGSLNGNNLSGHVEFACAAGGTTLYMYDIDNADWSEESKKLAYFCDYTDEIMEGIVVLPQVEKPIDKNISLWIQSGCDAGDGMVLNIGGMNASILDIHKINVLTQDNAEDAIDKISTAIKKLSEQRSRIGAYQNRLEHTIKNEENIVENTTAAESRIRDTDMADEMVKYSNSNIIMQAGQSMLAQSNQSKQGILSLLSA